MVARSYRFTEGHKEILRVLNLNCHNKCHFLVWQKNVNSETRNFLIEAELDSVDLDIGVFSIHVDDEHKHKFDPEKETFFLMDGHDLAFKTRLSLTQSKLANRLTFLAPKKVRMLELRSHPRVYFTETNFHNVNVVFKARTENVKGISSVCRILNISKGGVCIIISKETLSAINVKKELIIEGLNFFEQIGDVKKAVIKNARLLSPKTLKSDELYALGVEFQNE